MTYDDLTCDNCGSYGDVICIDCKLSGNPDYCFCEECIEEHMEMHEREDEAEQETPSFAQGECPNCGLDWTAHSAWIGNPGDKTCVEINEDDSDYGPYYSRADEMADLANADYYDEIARGGQVA